ncbi:unnamed protein product [Orchesella dallaii]|uniref:Uncharacterized protein n=1 Tax=Orchesella dallaii TaxID=48710 RepID=A0ABP1Q093_9HEXA
MVVSIIDLSNHHHKSHGSFSHPVFNVNPMSMHPQYFAPAPYPVQYPFVSVFMSNDGQIHAVSPPPQPPQHCTQCRHTAVDSTQRYHNANILFKFHGPWQASIMIHKGKSLSCRRNQV